jgi:hypothetical protein
MKTSIWGPSAWRFLHAVTFAYPEEPTDEHKEAALNLFKSLRILLPCGDCCNHYCREFEKNGVEAALGSRKELARWLWEFHNTVNSRLGKPEFEWDRVVAEFGAEDGDCTLNSYCGDQVQAEAKAEAAEAPPMADPVAKAKPMPQPQPQPMCGTGKTIHVMATILTLIAFCTVLFLIFSR